jgi:hypothetical protein
MRSWKFLLPLLTSTLCFAAQSDRIAGTIDSGQMVALPGQVQRKALPKYDEGRVTASFQLKEVMLLTLPTPSQQKALSLLVAEQQDPKSPNFRKWLTPEQYADRFGLSPNDVQKITAWLKSQGLTVVSVARDRNWVVFSGTAAQVETAFRTEFHHYNVDGEMHFANATAPSIPAALSGIATGFRGFDDFRPKPTNVRKAGPRSRGARPDYYDSSFPAQFVAPGDIEVIYDLTPLYNTGIDGTGQKLVIVGQTDVYLADLNDFRSGFGLPAITGCSTDANGVITTTACNTSNFRYVLDGDPGVSTNGDVTEADLDLEWSAATAPGAQIIFVNSPNVFTSYYYAIDQDYAPVISMSYGAPCEFDDNNLPNDEVELTIANAEGITFMNSSGDSGAASCDGPQNSGTNNLAVGGLAVSYPASSPEVTAVGGTAITYPGGFGPTYWGTPTTNPTNGGTAQNPPLPETSWNDDEELALLPGSQYPNAQLWQENYAIVQSGGGASNCAVQTSDFSNCVSGFPQPSWQTVTVPLAPAGVRYVPDVSLLASPNFPGYIFCTPLDQWISSASTASSCASSSGGAAGIIAALALTDSSGNPAPTVVGGTSASSPVFAGIVALLNQYLATNGLGNINPTLYTLAKTTSNGAFHQVTSGDNMVYCEIGQPPAPWPVALQCPAAGIFGYNAFNADTTTGYNLVTGLGSVDANNLAIAWAGSSTSPNFTVQTTTNFSPASVPAGQSASATLTIAPVNGSTQTVNFTNSTSSNPGSCSAGLPAGALCTFTNPNNPGDPTSVTLDGTNSQTLTLTITTAANMTTPVTPTITVTGTAGSTSHTSQVSLTVTATTESYTLASTNGVTFSTAQGGSQAIDVVVASTTGFIVGSGTSATTALAITYTCSATPALAISEIACQVSPGNGQPTNATAVTVSLVTTAPTAQLKPLGGSRIFYALLLPGLYGIVFVAGSRTRGMRLLGLIVVLGCSTLWLGACSSGGSSTVKNPGTPTGPYAVTINATTGGANPLTFSLGGLTLNVTAP